MANTQAALEMRIARLEAETLEITEAADEFREYLRDEEMLGLLRREA